MLTEGYDVKWQKLPGHQSLKGRAGHSTTLVGHKLFILGGRNGNEFFDDVWVFDLELEKWNQLEQKVPFTPRAYHTTTLIGNQYLWVIGGSNRDTLFDDVYVLNTSTLQWSCPAIKGSIARRGTHAAVMHPLESRAILIHGGYGGTDPHWLGDLSLLRTDSLEWYALSPGGKSPHARGYHSLTTVGAYVILFGGKGDAGIVKEDYLSIYDVVRNKWVIPKVEGDAPLPRSNHAATLMDADMVIIHGGRNGTIRLSDMFVLKMGFGKHGSAPTLCANCTEDLMHVLGISERQSLTSESHLIKFVICESSAYAIMSPILGCFQPWILEVNSNGLVWSPFPLLSATPEFRSLLQVPCSSASRILTSCVKWHLVEKNNNTSVKSRKSVGKKTILNTESDSPLGRAAHSLIARDHALYIFGGYGGQGLTFDDIFVFRNFPALPGLDRKNTNDTVASDAQAPFLIEDDSDEENAKHWRSTKRQKQQSNLENKSVSRLQEVGQSLKQGLDMTPLRNRDVQDNRIQLPETVDRMQKQSSRVPRAQAVSSERALAMIGQEKNMLEKEVTNLRHQLESLKENIKNKTCIEDELRADKLQLQEEIASLNEKRGDLANIIKVLEKKTCINDELRAEKLCLQEEIASLNEKRGDLANIIKVLEKKVQLSIQKNKNLESHNECMKTQIKDLRSSLEEKESKCFGLAQEASDAQHKCEELKMSLDNEKSLCIEVVRERDEYKTYVERLQSELEKQMQALQQVSLKFENEKTFLQHEIAETKVTTNKLLTDLGMSKESARALQETADRQAKQLEDEKNKVCALQKVKEELSQNNAVISAENKQLLSARDSANLHFDFLKSELQTTRALHEQTAAEVIRLQKLAEQSKEHIASLHESLKKDEEAIKTKDQELVQLRVIINEVEQFEQTQMTKLQQHVEKLKCTRQSCPL